MIVPQEGKAVAHVHPWPHAFQKPWFLLSKDSWPRLHGWVGVAWPSKVGGGLPSARVHQGLGFFFYYFNLFDSSSPILYISQYF